MDNILNFIPVIWHLKNLWAFDEKPKTVFVMNCLHEIYHFACNILHRNLIPSPMLSTFDDKVFFCYS